MLQSRDKVLNGLDFTEEKIVVFFFTDDNLFLLKKG